VERCRHCGYDFSIAGSPEPDLRIRQADTMPNPLGDLDLLDAATPAAAPDRFTDAPAERPHQDVTNPVAELPLFGPPITDDVPLITRPSPPRQPLSVRRATPEVPRLRAEPRAPMLDWQADTAPASTPTPRPAPTPRPMAREQGAPSPAARARVPDTPAVEPAAVPARAIAAAIDLLVLAAVDLVVVYFTLKICRLGFDELALLPKAPLVAFLVLQNLGYFVSFTAAGQTLGKMVTGLRVLADDGEHAPDVGRSALRALVWLVLALPAGIGLLSALFSRDGRGLHDRFAGTRVVRAGA
jgi:uncharacterized RDD family membrane protein YckC